MTKKGSVCINRVSLTAFNVSQAIIPYMFEHTGFHKMQTGDAVNLEFDLLGKYFLSREQLKEE